LGRRWPTAVGGSITPQVVFLPVNAPAINAPAIYVQPCALRCLLIPMSQIIPLVGECNNHCQFNHLLVKH
jgi:hypothetical protein